MKYSLAVLALLSNSSAVKLENALGNSLSLSATSLVMLEAAIPAPKTLTQTDAKGLNQVSIPETSAAVQLNSESEKQLKN